MPDQITRLLDQIERADSDANSGPWRINEVMNGDYLVHGDEDIAEAWGKEQATFIALSRTALPALSRAVRAVLAHLGQLEVKYDDYNAIDHIVHSITHELRQAINDALGDDDGN